MDGEKVKSDPSIFVAQNHKVYRNTKTEVQALHLRWENILHPLPWEQNYFLSTIPNMRPC